LNGAPVAKSPYNVNIDKPKGYPDALKCYAEGPGLQGANTAEPANFTIYAKDSNGNTVQPKENPFVVDITQPDGTELTPNVVDNRNGTYSVSYQPTETGPHEITVGLKNPAAPVYFDHIKDSPFHVNATQGTDPSKTKVYGPALEEGVQDNLPTYFTIEARDTKDQPKKTGGDPFDVKIKGPNGRDVPADIVDNGDGTYTVNFAPNDAGAHTIDVGLKGRPVANSPYHINVREGADHTTSLVGVRTFVIEAKTKTGKPMTRGGEKFTVSIKGPQGDVRNDVKDLGNGTYLVTYTIPDGKGSYTYSAKVNNKDIRGSPWEEKH